MKPQLCFPKIRGTIRTGFVHFYRSFFFFFCMDPQSVFTVTEQFQAKSNHIRLTFSTYSRKRVPYALKAWE